MNVKVHGLPTTIFLLRNQQESFLLRPLFSQYAVNTRTSSMKMTRWLLNALEKAACGVGKKPHTPRAKMLSILGQMKPINVHPYRSPRNIPITDMPSGSR